MHVIRLQRGNSSLLFTFPCEIGAISRKNNYTGEVFITEVDRRHRSLLEFAPMDKEQTAGAVAARVEAPEPLIVRSRPRTTSPRHLTQLRLPLTNARRGIARATAFARGAARRNESGIAPWAGRVSGIWASKICPSRMMPGH